MEEIWADIDGCEKYQVSNLGNVRNSISMHILKQQVRRNGYKVISLKIYGIIKTLYVHRLVANAFCKKEEGKDHVDHINCIRDDNRSENLRWCTPKENCNFPQTRANASNALKIAMNKKDVKEKLSKAMEKVFKDTHVIDKMSKSSIQNHKNGLYDHLRKKVLMIDAYGKTVKVYPSVSSVLNDGSDPSYVSKACRNKKDTAYGYVWRFELI